MPRSAALLSLLVVVAACARPAAVSPTKSPPSAAPKAETAFGPQTIDLALREEWKRAAVSPAARADDATFLRRAWIDIVGTVPPPEATTTFLADPSPQKRQRLVDELLAAPGYADHWTTYWDNVLMGADKKGRLVDREAFREWLHARFSASTPWDRMTSELVAATGQNGPARAQSVNGAVNWALRFEQNRQDLGGSAARIFLGVQIQCAQCHDHKTEHWKQDDFRRFASAFLRARVEPIDVTKGMGPRRVEVIDAPAPRRAPKNAELEPLVHARATALDGTDLEKGPETRKALAGWMTSKQNPWFAKAFVNRMWGHFLGRGFYDPVDDIRPSNPATAPALLDRLAADFAAHDFDIKRLIRTICATEAYQLAADAGAKPDPENKLWARFHLVPLGPEELLASILRVTDLEKAADKAGIKNMDALRATIGRQYAFLFDTDEDDDEPDYSGTVSQALALLNGALVNQGARSLPGSAVFDLVRAPGTDAEKIDALVLRILARRPTAAERERWLAYVNGAAEQGSGLRPVVGSGPRSPLDRLGKRRVASAPKQAAYEDIAWSLLNSSEFTFNH